MKASRDVFTELLAGHEPALRAISGDVLYHVQVHLIRDVLDVADEVAGHQAAGRLAGALAERWAEAPARIAEAQEAASALMLAPPDLSWLPAGRSGA